MATPVTFSGFNDIDFNVVLNALMAQASQPLTALQARQASLKAQMTALGALASRIAALNSAASAFTRPGTFSLVSAASGDADAVRASASASARPGQHEVVVHELARAQVMVSESAVIDPDTTVVATGGTLTIGGVDVTIGGDVTLQALADAINGTSGIGVSAAVVRTAPGSYRLTLASRGTGAAQAFVVTNTLSGGAGVVFPDNDANGVSGDSAADSAVTASDALIWFNNIPITSPTNRFDDVVPGLTLTVLRRDAATPVRIDVATDTATVRDQLTAFVASYNELVAFIGEQRSAAAQNAGGLGRDPMLRTLHGQMRAILLSSHGTGAIQRLAEAGISFDRTGRLQLDGAALDRLAAHQPDELRAFMAGTSGPFAAITSAIATYTQADGLIPSNRRRIEQQVAAMNDHIDAMQRRLALQREALQRQFIEADRAMSRLRSQADALGSFAASFRSVL